jgi:hypothetical protein
MKRRVRLKAAEKYVGAIGNLSTNGTDKSARGIAVILDVIEKAGKENA